MSAGGSDLPSSSSALDAPSAPEADIIRSKNWRWYKPAADFDVSAVGRQLFEQYSGIAPAEVNEHIIQERDRAWEIFPWPCIGEFWFVSFGLSLHPEYSRLLARLRTPSSPRPMLLDLGTCLGQDLRKLLVDGAPMESLFGSDIFPAYEAAGHALFKDASTFTDRFIAGDIFDVSPRGALVKTEGMWDVIVIYMFLHVFDLNDQRRACARILDLLSGKPGSIVIGAQTATIKPGEQKLLPPFVKPGEHKSVYRHSRETFNEMWVDIGKSKGVDLKIWAEYEALQPEVSGNDDQKKFFTGSEQRRLFFTIERD